MKHRLFIDRATLAIRGANDNLAGHQFQYGFAIAGEGFAIFRKFRGGMGARLVRVLAALRICTVTLTTLDKSDTTPPGMMPNCSRARLLRHRRSTG
jgi:hypothetical protein